MRPLLKKRGDSSLLLVSHKPQGMVCAPCHQQADHATVDKHLSEVLFTRSHPEKVKDYQDAGDVHAAVQSLPVSCS